MNDAPAASAGGPPPSARAVDVNPGRRPTPATAERLIAGPVPRPASSAIARRARPILFPQRHRGGAGDASNRRRAVGAHAARCSGARYAV